MGPWRNPIGRILLTVALCGAAEAAFAQQPAEPKPFPRAVVKDLGFNAGAVTRGEPIKHVFIVENQGNAVLEITGVKPSCGCTVTQYDPKIDPGKTGKITATVTTSAFSGAIQKLITVTTSDPAMATFQLTIAADIHAALNVRPSESQSFGLVFKGNGLEKEFTISSDDGAAFQVTSVKSEDPALKYALAPAQDGKSVTFKVTLPEDHPVGAVTGRFTLATTCPKMPSLTIGVYGSVREPLTLTPTEVRFDGLSKTWLEAHSDDSALTRTLSLSDDQSAALEVTSATSTLSNVEVKVKELEAKKRYSVELRLKPPVRMGAFSGEVAILTNQKTFKVPVTGSIF